MKFKYLPVLMIAFALTLSACDSDSDDDGDDGNVALGKMEASIDGTQWDATNATANKVSAAGFVTITIAGAKVTSNNSSADAMTISFASTAADPLGTGTFTLGTAPLASMSFISGTDLTKTFLATSGTVTITTIDDYDVKGTFSFEAEHLVSGDTVTVTSGSFDVEWGITIGL